MGLLIRIFLNKKKSYKLSKKQQVIFVTLLAGLLLNGFTLQESFLFMKKSQSIPTKSINYLVDCLEKGEPLSQQMKLLGFTDLVATQISFAQAHGQLPETLQQISHHLKAMDKHQSNLFKVVSYPVLLCFFLLIVLLAIRQLLLPQLLATKIVRADSLGIRFIQELPYYFLGLFGCGSLCCFFCLISIQKKSALRRATLIVKLPIIGYVYQLYLSAFFALEWGKLFDQGLDLQTIIKLMQTTTCDLRFKELAYQLEEQTKLGDQLSEGLSSYSFLLPELTLIIQQGELKGKLGKELIFYSELCWQQFFKKIEQQMQWIQPLVFLLVALLIVGFYAAMLLPIYGGMEDFL